MDNTNLYSIGHGGKTIEELVFVLHKFGIKYLIDVRSVPYSKFYPHFNREVLKSTIESTGDIKYLYMGDVIGGLPKDDSFKTNGKMDYSKMQRDSTFQQGVARLVHANELGIPVCVMCSESDPSHCHRSKLIGVCLKEKGVVMMHIVKNHSEDYVLKSQTEVINEVLGGKNQMDLFGEITTFSSVKTH
ncbi:MAG: DUF488 domain-containing protein [Bacteroidales bacterium]|nr:DUF488 domain-containing protein [Bacteroidales bacterium]